jgi:hypothetical protein
LSSSSSVPFSFPCTFFAADAGIKGIIDGDGIKVEADAAVDQVTCRFTSCCYVPEGTSLGDADDFAGNVGIEAGCGGGIEEVEANTGIDWVMLFDQLLQHFRQSLAG